MREGGLVDPGKFFEVESLEDTYIAILQHHDTRHAIHTTRLVLVLLSKNENLEKGSIRIKRNECAVGMFQEHSIIFST